mgnify:CR=1 FL=1
MVTDIILTVDKGGEVSTDEYTNSNEADANLDELRNMPDEELEAQGIVGFIGLTYDENDDKFYVSDSYSISPRYDEDVRAMIRFTLKKYNKKNLSESANSLLFNRSFKNK